VCLPDTIAPVLSTLYLFLLRPPLPHGLSRTPWLLLLPPPPGIVALATLAPVSFPSYRVTQLSLALGAEMIPRVIPASLVSTSGCSFLAPLLEPFNPNLVHCDLWTSPIPSVSGYKYYLVIFDDCTHYLLTFLLRQKSDTFPTRRLSRAAVR
jgi:hypothetical protein